MDEGWWACDKWVCDTSDNSAECAVAGAVHLVLVIGGLLPMDTTQCVATIVSLDSPRASLLCPP